MSLKTLGWATLFSAILWAIIILPFVVLGAVGGTIFWLVSGFFFMTVILVADQMEKFRR